MICLACHAAMSGEPPLTCPGCGKQHDSRSPVVGVNHFSQVLSALDSWAEEELSQEEFEEIFFQFVELLETLDEKWGFREVSLVGRLTPELRKTFGPQLLKYDEAIRQGFLGVETVEVILAGESDDFEAAESHLLAFFQGFCSASATLLDDLDSWKRA